MLHHTILNLTRIPFSSHRLKTWELTSSGARQMETAPRISPIVQSSSTETTTASWSVTFMSIPGSSNTQIQCQHSKSKLLLNRFQYRLCQAVGSSELVKSNLWVSNGQTSTQRKIFQKLTSSSRLSRYHSRSSQSITSTTHIITMNSLSTKYLTFKTIV